MTMILQQLQNINVTNHLLDRSDEEAEQIAESNRTGFKIILVEVLSTAIYPDQLELFHYIFWFCSLWKVFPLSVRAFPIFETHLTSAFIMKVIYWEFTWIPSRCIFYVTRCDLNHFILFQYFIYYQTVWHTITVQTNAASTYQGTIVKNLYLECASKFRIFW